MAGKSFKSKMQERFNSIEKLNADSDYESKHKNIEMRQVSTLKELPENDIIPSLKQDDFNNLFNSIQKDNEIRVPIHISKENVVLCGNNRLRIAKELGIKEVPVIVVDIKKEQYLFYAIEDNLFRRQLNDAQKADMILLLKPEIQKIHLASKTVNFKKDKSSKCVGSNTLGRTAYILAKKAGISKDALKKSEKIKKEAPSLFKKVKAGKVSIHQAYNQVKTTKPESKTFAGIKKIGSSREKLTITIFCFDKDTFILLNKEIKSLIKKHKITTNGGK